jgi:hypothetical protein
VYRLLTRVPKAFSAVCVSIPALFILYRDSHSQIGETILFFIPAYLLNAYLVNVGVDARLSFDGRAMSPATCGPAPEGRLLTRLLIAIAFGLTNLVIWRFLIPLTSDSQFVSGVTFLLFPVLAGIVICDPGLRWFIALGLAIPFVGEKGGLSFAFPVFAMYYLLVDFGITVRVYVRERKRCNLAELSR